MKVLGLAGSPLRDGNTDILLAEMLKGAVSKGAEVHTINLSELNIGPCTHCEACLIKGECKFHDDMQSVYRAMEEADYLVLASPLHFMGVTAQMKLMIDRCQAIWARKYILKIPPLGDRRKRKGFFISVGGQRTIANLFEGAIVTVKSLFRSMDVEYAGDLLFPGIDAKCDILNSPEALNKAFEAGRNLVEN